MNDSEKEIIRTTWALYIKTWKKALQILFDYSDNQIKAWISQKAEMLKGVFPTMIFHEEPQKYIMDIFVIEYKISKIDDNQYKLVKCIEDALDDRGRYDPVSSDFDWYAARRRIEVVLTRHRKSMPSGKSMLEGHKGSL